MSDQRDWAAFWRELGWHTPPRENALALQLRQRAQQYARPTPGADTDDREATAYTVLGFQLGAEQYGLDVVNVYAVRPVERIVPVPGVPAFYPGVVNLRGQIVTVLDLRPFFGLPLAVHNPPQELILVRTEALELAILAHQVKEVMRIPVSQVTQVEEARYSYGVTPEGLTLLDVEQLLADPRLIVGEEE